MPSGLIALMVVAGPSPALGCTGMDEPTLDMVAQRSELIVEGTVEEVLLDGLAFRLTVREVFKGPPLANELRVGATSNSAGRGCEVTMSQGDHVILGVVDPDQQLNALTTALWFVGPDGMLSSPGSLWTLAADADELRNSLRAAIPDTALPHPAENSRLAWLLLPLVAALVAVGVAKRTA